jgi:penicillin V acylase-like amidase (Ntn superfamily)
LRKEAFRVVPIIAPTGEPGTVHLSISDASGDSAIFEFIDGKLVIHTWPRVPGDDQLAHLRQQLALAAYWKTSAAR